LAHLFLVLAPVHSYYVPKFMYTVVWTVGAQVLFSVSLTSRLSLSVLRGPAIRPVKLYLFSISLH